MVGIFLTYVDYVKIENISIKLEIELEMIIAIQTIFHIFQLKKVSFCHRDFPYSCVMHNIPCHNSANYKKLIYFAFAILYISCLPINQHKVSKIHVYTK